MITISTTEFSLSVNEFNEPKKYVNAEAICMLLSRLLLLEPGTIQSHPEMGVGLISKYRYSFAEDADKLKNDFQSQIDKYLPQFTGIKIEVSVKDKQFYISTKINNTLYSISYNALTSEITSSYKTLADL